MEVPHQTSFFQLYTPFQIICLFATFCVLTKVFSVTCALMDLPFTKGGAVNLPQAHHSLPSTRFACVLFPRIGHHVRVPENLPISDRFFFLGPSAPFSFVCPLAGEENRPTPHDSSGYPRWLWGLQFHILNSLCPLDLFNSPRRFPPPSELGFAPPPLKTLCFPFSEPDSPDFFYTNPVFLC